MNRRAFLSSTFLTGVGAVGFAGAARALSLQSCDDDQSTACREMLRHDELLTQLRTALDQKGLTTAQKQAALAAAICPVCGLPLLG